MQNSKKKLLLLHKTLRLSGASGQLLCLLNGLDRNKFEPIIVLQRSDRFYYKDLLNSEKVVFLTEKGGSIYQLVKRFIEVVKNEKPDYIQVINRRSNWLAYFSALFYKSPPVFGSVLNSKLKFKFLLAESVFRYCYKAVIVNSIATQNELYHRALLPKKKVRLIYLGIDTEKYYGFDNDTRSKLRSAYNIQDNDFIILSIGRIHKVKNLMCTLKAVNLLKEKSFPFIYFCVGPINDHELYNEMTCFIDEKQLHSNIRLINVTAQAIDYYNIADVTVLSSWSESLSMVMLESMACRCIPVVAESAEENSVICHGENGFRFPTNDEHRLAEIISTIANMDQTHKDNIREKARETVVHNYSIKRMVDQFQALYLNDMK